jgi:hypothetical protein
MRFSARTLRRRSPEAEDARACAQRQGRLVFGSRSKRGGPSLNHCPICGGDAVSAVEAVAVDGLRERVALRCAECDTWRRVVVTIWALQAYRNGQALERAEMAETLARLEHDRMVAATHTFIAALRRDLVEPPDFTA